jgi:hypothetical protein
MIGAREGFARIESWLESAGLALAEIRLNTVSTGLRAEDPHPALATPLSRSASSAARRWPSERASRWSRLRERSISKQEESAR